MTGRSIHQVRAQGIELRFDAMLGLLEQFTVTDDGREIAPLHTAPWVGTDEPMPPDAAPHMRKLGGDFFCAPFAQSDGTSALHGWPPNSEWEVTDISDGRLTGILRRKPKGATLTKELTVRDGHTFVYQRHAFAGGEGRITVANHANVSVRTGAFIRTSPKRVWETPDTPQESDPARGRSALLYPAQSDDPRAFPGTDRSTDLLTYPWNPAHEDFVMGLEAAGHSLGWTAVTRPAEGDLYLSLRNPRQAPMTMLWHSNGGRDYAPWSGRHRGCLGVEEGAAEHMLSLSMPSNLTGPGALVLDSTGAIEIRHVIGAINWPSAEAVRNVSILDGGLTVTGEGGARRDIAFDSGFLAHT